MGLIDRLTGRQVLVQEIQRLRQEIRALRESHSDAISNQGGMASISGLHAKILQLGPDGVVRYANTPMCDSLGSTKDDVIGRPIEEVDHMPWGSGEIAALVRRTGEGGPSEHEELREFTDPDTGSRHYHLVRIIHHSDRIQVLIEDVTAFKSLEEAFKRYVSPVVIEKMKHLEHDFFRPERYEMTVLFADLRGFTSMSEKMPPEDVRTMLNDWLRAMTDQIERHEATIDKFVGDEVMALFGAPIFFEDHAERAVRVAVEMQAAHRALCGRWETAGKTSVPMGVGVNTGEMVIGNIGSPRRMEYTVLGHPVNLASRLCDLAAGGEILIGAATLNRMRLHGAEVLAGLRIESRDSVKVKGITKAIDTFRVVTS